MTNFKGTKGNWHYELIRNSKCIICASNTSFSEVCLPIKANDTIEMEANALLISKAPEMLEMLENCFGMLDRIRPATEEEMLEMKNNIKKLIKEATEL